MSEPDIDVENGFFTRERRRGRLAVRKESKVNVDLEDQLSSNVLQVYRGVLITQMDNYETLDRDILPMI